jgi:hypothetical protein
MYFNVKYCEVNKESTLLILNGTYSPHELRASIKKKLKYAKIALL